MYYIKGFNTRRTKLSINIYRISDLTQILKINLEKLEKMTNYGAEDDPHRRVTGNFALYNTAGTK
jgi:hypothetical protein